MALACHLARWWLRGVPGEISLGPRQIWLDLRQILALASVASPAPARSWLYILARLISFLAPRAEPAGWCWSDFVLLLSGVSSRRRTS